MVEDHGYNPDEANDAVADAFTQHWDESRRSREVELSAEEKAQEEYASLMLTAPVDPEGMRNHIHANMDSIQNPLTRRMLAQTLEKIRSDVQPTTTRNPLWERQAQQFVAAQEAAAVRQARAEEVSKSAVRSFAQGYDELANDENGRGVLEAVAKYAQSRGERLSSMNRQSWEQKILEWAQTDAGRKIAEHNTALQRFIRNNLRRTS